MDAETWNETIRRMNEASRRSQQMVELSDALGRCRKDAEALGLSSVATDLGRLERETFEAGALIQSIAGDFERELEAAREAGEEPPD